MTYPNGAQTVFQVTCMGSVYSVEAGFFRNDGKGTDFKTFDDAWEVFKTLPEWEQNAAEIEEF